MSFVSASAATLGGSALIAGGSLASGYLGSKAAGKASDAQVAMEQQGLDLQRNELAQLTAARGRLDPWINTGTGATYKLGDLYGIGTKGGKPDYSGFTGSPDYKFALDQGNLGLQRYENANGMAMSGGALKDVSQFNQGLATQQFGNYFNRLMGLSQLGQTAASAGANSAFQGVQGANAAAGTLGQIGQSQASGIIGGTNAWTGGINNGISNSLLYGALQRNQPNNAAATNPSSYAPPNTNWNAPNPGYTPSPWG